MIFEVSTLKPKGIFWRADRKYPPSAKVGLVHELEESVTDPLGNGWYFANGDESADRCAWKFGTTYAATNGAKANVTLGTRDFLIQENWLAPNGGCALTH